MMLQVRVILGGVSGRKRVILGGGDITASPSSVEKETNIAHFGTV